MYVTRRDPHVPVVAFHAFRIKFEILWHLKLLTQGRLGPDNSGSVHVQAKTKNELLARTLYQARAVTQVVSSPPCKTGETGDGF